jgi:hypothetical protein
MKRVPDDFAVLRYAASFGLHPAQLLPRETVQEVECSDCHARPGSPCTGSYGQARVRNHLARCFDRIRLELPAQSEPTQANSPTDFPERATCPNASDQEWWDEMERQERKD